MESQRLGQDLVTEQHKNNCYVCAIEGDSVVK